MKPICELYFSNPAYDDYPVVGVYWDQANAFCAWRTDYLLKGLGWLAHRLCTLPSANRNRMEIAARGKNGMNFLGNQSDVKMTMAAITPISNQTEATIPKTAT